MSDEIKSERPEGDDEFAVLNKMDTNEGNGSEPPSAEKLADKLKLLELGFDDKVADYLAELFGLGILKLEELDERAIDAINSVRQDQALFVLKQFRETGNLAFVQNRASFICSLIKVCKDKMKQLGPSKAVAEPLINSPNETKMKEILERTGYSLEVTVGQRKYCSPESKDAPRPGAGCEVYVGKIPNEMCEDVLIPLFEQCGTIFDLRLMMDPIISQNKGYAFVTFTTKEAAQKAAKKYNDHEIRPGKRLKVNVSVANTRLFIGNIPKSKSKEDLVAEFSKVTEELSDVIIYHSPDDVERRRNRGFCFLEYQDHKAASNAKRKLQSGRVKVFNNLDLVVDWAEQQEEPDEDVMATVKVLYVKNLTTTVTENTLNTEFSKFGYVERVRKVKDYAFVHFAEREAAIKAMEALNGHVFEGLPCDVTLAKPQMDKQRREQMKQERERRQLPQMRQGPPPSARGAGMGYGYGRGTPGYPPRGRGFGRAPPPASAYGAYEPYAYDPVQAGYDDYGYADYGAAETYDDWGYGAGAEEDYYQQPTYGYPAGGDDYDPFSAAYQAPAAGGYGGRGRGAPMPVPKPRPVPPPRGAAGSAMGARRGMGVAGPYGRAVGGGGRPMGGAPARGLTLPARGLRPSKSGMLKRKTEGADASQANKRPNQGQGWVDRPIMQQPMGYNAGGAASGFDFADDVY